MADPVREKVLTALREVLYVAESDFVDGDATDLRDLGLDSVRFVLVLKHLGVDRGTAAQARFADDLSVTGWVAALRELEQERSL